jgi:hypothetical protein
MIYDINYHKDKDNPFGTEERENKLNQLLKNGLVKRITLIEGNYPNLKEQQDFLKRIKEWLAGGRNLY